MSASFPFLTHEMDEEAHFLLSFSPYISFLEERGRCGKKRVLTVFFPLSPFLSFFLFGEGKEWEWEGENVCKFKFSFKKQNEGFPKCMSFCIWESLIRLVFSFYYFFIYLSSIFPCPFSAQTRDHKSHLLQLQPWKYTLGFLNYICFPNKLQPLLFRRERRSSKQYSK